MRRLRIPHPLLDSNYRGYLASDYSTGTSITLANNNSFSANDLAVFGEPKEELTELKKIDSLSGSTGLVLNSALNFAHPKGTPVQKSLWDFVEIEGAPSSTDAMALLTQSAIQWDNPNGETVYFHSAGNDNWAYRFRFYNSATGLYSEYSPTLLGFGFTRKQVGYMIRNVRKLTNTFDQSVCTDDELIRQFNRAQDIIYAHNRTYWFLLVDTFKASDYIPCTANESVYSLVQYLTFGHLEGVRYRYTSGSIDNLSPLDKKSSLEFDKIASNLNHAANDYPLCYKLLPADSNSANGYIQIYPKTKTDGVLKLYPNYYEKMHDLSEVSDETQVPMPEILEDFAISFIYKLKGDENKANLYESGLISNDENKVPRYLQLLDKLDNAQKKAQSQPKSLWNYKGRRALARIYGGNSGYDTRDSIKESGIYDEYR